MVMVTLKPFINTLINEFECLKPQIKGEENCYESDC